MESELAAGRTCEIGFTVSAADQQAFAALSGDTNPVHLDQAFARSHGFSAPVVYGALLVAKLSQIIGMHLPGPAGLWSGLSMNFRQPLLVGQEAKLSVEITQVSEAARSLVLKVAVRCGETLVADGKAMATLL